MANLVCNISKGRVAELYNRVDTGDPADARLYVIPISAGAVSDATLADADDFAAMVTAGVTERTASGWNRKTLAAADLATMTPDDVNDRMPLDFADQTWTAVTADAVTDLVVCYASVASPTNAQLTPLTVHDFAITPDGSDVVATVADFYRAA
jgi:predicted naringenin-chalcone synthase